MPTYKRVSGNLNIVAVDSGSTITLDASNVAVSSNLTTGNLTVTANIQANGVSTTGNLTANYFFGDGQYLTNVIANVGGASILQNGFTNVDIPDANGNVLVEINGVANVLSITQTELTMQGTVAADDIRTNRIASDDSAFVTVSDGLVVDGTLDVVGNIDATGDVVTVGNINGDYILGNGALLTGVITSVANINSGTTILSVVAQNGNIQATVDSTPVLTITPQGLNLTGNISVSANALISGNLTVSGTQTIANVDALTVSDPIISLGRGANDSPLTTNDGLDRGTELWYYTSQEQTAFIGYLNSAANLVAATNVTISNNIVTVNDYGAFVAGDIYGDSLITTGNITGAFILGNGSQLSGIDTTSIQSGSSSVSVIAAGGNIRANVAGNTVALLSTQGQNITGNLVVSGHAAITGNITGANISATGNVTGSNVITAGLVSLSSITKTGSNGVGNIGSASNTFDTVFARATSAQYADLAELYLADHAYAAGTVVMFGGSHEITQCNDVDSHRVAGVISQNPAYIMNAGLQGAHVLPVALVGRVHCLVRAPAEPGDILVSDTQGYARVNNHAAAGRIIGKALVAVKHDGLAEIVVGKH